MKICPKCGRKIPATESFCPNDGTDMRNVPLMGQMQRPVAPKKPMSKKQKTIITSIAAIIVVVAAFFVIGNKVYSRANQVNKIMTTLQDPNKKGMAKLVTDDQNVKPTDELLKPTQMYYKNNPAKADDLRATLKYGDGNEDVTLVQKGHYFLVFPKYQLKLKAITPQIKTNHAGSNIYINGKSVGTAKGNDSNYYLKMGTIFPGEYSLKVKSKVSGRKLEADVNQNIWSSKTVNMNIKTGSFKVQSAPNGKIYINNKYVGTLNDKGEKTFKDYPIIGNMSLYIEGTFNGNKEKSEQVNDLADALNDEIPVLDSFDALDSADVVKKDGDYVVIPQWKNLVHKDDAKSLLENNIQSPVASNFVDGGTNKDYGDLKKLTDGWNDNDNISDYKVEVEIESILPAGDDLSQVNYKVTYTFDNNDNEKTQIMEFKGGIIKYSKDDGNKIKTIGVGKMIKQATIDESSDDSDN